MRIRVSPVYERLGSSDDHPRKSHPSTSKGATAWLRSSEQRLATGPNGSLSSSMQEGRCGLGGL